MLLFAFSHTPFLSVYRRYYRISSSKFELLVEWPWNGFEWIYNFWTNDFKYFVYYSFLIPDPKLALIKLLSAFFSFRYSLFCNSSLRKLLAGHNQLARLPERLERTSVEVLDVQHNQLLELPPNLLMKADR